MNLLDFEVTIPFGKYRSQPISNIDTGYISWLLDNADHGWVHENRDLLTQELADRRALAMAAMPEYELNDGQKAAVLTLVAWLEGPGSTEASGDMTVVPHAKLEGGAGYGKSFATMDLVKQAQAMGYKVAACAPSYVATQVLAKQLDPLGVPTMTIARTIKLTVEYNGPEQVYVASEDTQPALAKLLGPQRLLIVDEGFMVNDTTARWMLDAAAVYGGKLLICGDTKQLPPVGQSTPSIFTKIELGTMLTEPMRYAAGSTLHALEQHSRANPHQIEWKAFEGPEVVLHPDPDTMVMQYVADYRANPREDLRMMFFRRKDAVNHNAAIRQHLHGVEEALAHPVLDGEKLMVMATAGVVPIDMPPTDIDGNSNAVRFYSSTTFVANDVVEDEEFYEATVGKLNYRLMFMVTEHQADATKAGGAAYNAECKRLAAEATEAQEMGQRDAWAHWRAYKAQFIPVGYAYAMTVHRCQGQTVDRAYFNPSQLLASGNMGKPLAYVAETRARKAVHVLVHP